MHCWKNANILFFMILVVSNSAIAGSVDSTNTVPIGTTGVIRDVVQPQHSQVLVIGAGPAGVAAAARLMENGILDVTVLEAEGRIGGRTRSVPFGSENVVDLGAQWVSGSKGNVVYEMAQPLGLLDESSPMAFHNMRYLRSNGTVPDQEFLHRLFNISMNLSEDTEHMLNYSGSLGQYFMEKYTEVTSNPANGFSDDPDLLSDFVPFFQEFVAFGEGSETWWDLSAKGINQSWICEGDQGIHWKNNGYSSVIDLLTKRYPNPELELPVRNKTHLRTEVQTINWGPNAVEGPTGKKSVVVETSDGARYTADFVVVTVSLGVLKEKAVTMFNPPLPERKMKAIQYTGFGHVDKLFLHFNETWWPTNITGYNFIPSNEDRERFHRMHPQYKEKGDWVTSLAGFHLVPRQPRSVLYSWLVGKPARNMEKYTDEEVRDACMRWLEMFIGRPLPQPVNFIRSKWYSNPHFRGSYTYRSLDTENYGALPSHIAEPLSGQSGNPEVLFGGETTHDHHYGYVHGAIETGWREADRILGILRNGTPAATSK